MKALPDPTPNGMACPNPSTHDARQQDGEAVLVGGDTPIAVWRLDARDDASSIAPRSGLASRLARRLILLYTRRGDTIVDFDSDPNLEKASSSESRRYLSLNDPSAVAEIAGPVSLVFLGWSTPPTPATRASIADRFGACQLILRADICAIAAVRAALPGQPGPTFAEHLDEILAAARAAGMACVLRIVAVIGAWGRDEFLYYATPAEAQAARHVRTRATRSPGDQVDLLVFASGKPRISDDDALTDTAEAVRARDDPDRATRIGAPGGRGAAGHRR
jgi:hypothetical protein